MILRNSLRCPDGTELISRHRHDYVEHTDANGKVYMVDGGTDYLKRSANGDEIDTSIVVADTDYEENVVRENLMWATYGKDGDEPLRWVALKDMETGHIEAVLESMGQIMGYIEPFRLKAMEHELHLRETQGTKA